MERKKLINAPPMTKQRKIYAVRKKIQIKSEINRSIYATINQESINLQSRINGSIVEREAASPDGDVKKGN